MEVKNQIKIQVEMDFQMKAPFEIMAAECANVQLNIYYHVVNIVAKIAISLRSKTYIGWLHKALTVLPAYLLF